GRGGRGGRARAHRSFLRPLTPLHLASRRAMSSRRSTQRAAYPASLSYQLTTLKKRGLSSRPAAASKMLLRRSPMKSLETTSSSVYPRIPAMVPPAASCIAALISARLAARVLRKVRSTTDTVAVGTRNAVPVRRPFKAGMHSVTALAAPVLDGMMFRYALRPPRQSFLLGPSCVGWVAVTEWTVVMSPSSSPTLSWMTFATGARQLVVQLALLITMWRAGSKVASLTPRQMVGTCAGSLLVGAEMTTRFAPAFRWLLAVSNVVKSPVDSRT